MHNSFRWKEQSKIYRKSSNIEDVLLKENEIEEIKPNKKVLELIENQKDKLESELEDLKSNKKIVQ